MTPLETYLRELRDIRSSGAAVKETSYYPALSRHITTGFERFVNYLEAPLVDSVPAVTERVQ